MYIALDSVYCSHKQRNGRMVDNPIEQVPNVLRWHLAHIDMSFVRTMAWVNLKKETATLVCQDGDCNPMNITKTPWSRYLGQSGAW